MGKNERGPMTAIKKMRAGCLRKAYQSHRPETYKMKKVKPAYDKNVKMSLKRCQKNH